jgi:hypothetical protein
MPKNLHIRQPPFDVLEEGESISSCFSSQVPAERLRPILYRLNNT